ncbi:hypothetical protein F5B22DRAFT_184493 [Xylaria bambusicola]|uniref:uncharacterized protein n=1 Tax=Xylaria bambusicola TaxID=326684 RepID=UPI002007C978|nr:uncharacterized protein F5B22DRAFT_184493 [Xylaria bambusicola]KAI0515345.1 hypothetical protein F5B22DRAFT_184493 [Xylaria bambusicola]
MPFILEVPKEYGYILAVATASVFVNTAHKIMTSMTRNASGVPYPNTYATKEEIEKNPKALKFNLAQRAHANFIENHSSFITALLIAGVGYPSQATWAGSTWVFGRVLYAIGYINFGPPGRGPGYLISQLGKMALTTMAVLTCWNML